MSSPEQARVGSVLDQKWTLERLLGAGAMGSVYEARHRNGARAAVKLLHPMLAREPEVRERFLREGYAANKVEHKGAVRVLDDDVVESGPDEGTAYLVMELLDGESLDDRQRRLPQLGEHELLVVAEQVLEVLSVAHASGVVHRDLKPENLFLAKDDDRVRVKVLDFGLARVSDGGLATNAGRALGTPAFMSPEQASGRVDEIDGRTDLFALGATLFRVLSGRRVHDGENAIQVLVQMQREPAPKLAEVFPEVSPAFARIVDRALAFEKASRYPTAAEMLADVKAARESLGLAGSVSLLAGVPVRNGAPAEPESLLSQDVIAVISTSGAAPVKGAAAFANTMVAMPSPIVKERASASVELVGPPTVGGVAMRPPTASEHEPFPPPSPPSELAIPEPSPSAPALSPPARVQAAAESAVPLSPPLVSAVPVASSQVLSSFVTDETALPSTNVPEPAHGLTPTDVAPRVTPAPVPALAVSPAFSSTPEPAQSVAAPDVSAAAPVAAAEVAPGTFPSPAFAASTSASRLEATLGSDASPEPEPETLGAAAAPVSLASSEGERETMELRDRDADRETSELPPEPRLAPSAFEVVPAEAPSDADEPLEALPTTRLSWVPIAGGVALLALIAVGYLASRGETRTSSDTPTSTEPSASAAMAEPTSPAAATAEPTSPTAAASPMSSSEPQVVASAEAPHEAKVADEPKPKPAAHHPQKPAHPTLAHPAVPHAGKPRKPPHAPPHPKK